MATGIRFPLDQPADKGYKDTYEETRTTVEMTTGPDRVRNKFRSAPRVFDVSWRMTPAQYRLFDLWWQETVKGTEREFDLQILDDTETLVWYTARWIKVYRAEISSENGVDWIVSGQVRAEGAAFEVREPGTDELSGRAAFGMQARGTLQIGVLLGGRANLTFYAQSHFKTFPLAGRASIKFGPKGHLRSRPFYGRAQFTFGAKGTPGTFGDPTLILDFDAVTYTADLGGAVTLQFDSTVYFAPHVVPF